MGEKWIKIVPGDPGPLNGTVALLEAAPKFERMPTYFDSCYYGLIVRNWDGLPIGIEDGKSELKPTHYFPVPDLVYKDE